MKYKYMLFALCFKFALWEKKVVPPYW